MTEIEKELRDLPKVQKRLRAISAMKMGEVHSLQNQLNLLRQATITAQMDVAQICMLAEGETQDALQRDVYRFLQTARTHLKNIIDLLTEKE